MKSININIKKNKTFEDELEENNFCESISSFTKWGHYIGNLKTLFEKNFIEKVINKDKKLTHLKILETFKFSSRPSFHNIIRNDYDFYNVMKYTNPTPLILDNIKSILYMGSTDYIIGEIDNEKYLLFKNYNEIPLTEYLKHNDKNNVINFVQRIFVFNWIMCVKNGLCLSYENNIFIKSINPFVTNTIECKSCIQCFSINEYNYQINTEKSISPTILDRWFDGKVETFYELAKQILEGTNVDIFRDRFKKVIMFYEPDYIPWVNAVYDRMNFIKSY